MLKIRYQTAGNKITGWCGDQSQFDGLVARAGEAVVEWDIAIPSWPTKACLVNTGTSTIELDPAYLPDVPVGVTRAIVAGFQAGDKPIRITRNWQGYDLEFNCYTSQQAFESYQSSDLSIGDHVLVVFVDGEKDKAIVIDKVYLP